MKSRGVAYLLWACGLMGIGGLHRFYLGRTVSGWMYLFTFDLCLIGLIADYKLIPAMVDDANRRLVTASASPGTVVNIASPAPPVVVQEVIREVVKIRCAYCGHLTKQGPDLCGECGARL